MSIATKGGDEGKTSLMFGERVSKSSVRVCAYGSVDELSASIGLVRAEKVFLSEELLEVQHILIKLMTELATPSSAYAKLLEKNIPLLSEDDLKKIEDKIIALEAENLASKTWLVPGENKIEAALNVSRTICRRAERNVVILNDLEDLPSKLPIKFLNRLSDLFYLWSCKARK